MDGRDSTPIPYCGNKLRLLSSSILVAAGLKQRIDSQNPRCQDGDHRGEDMDERNVACLLSV